MAPFLISHILTILFALCVIDVLWASRKRSNDTQLIWGAVIGAAVTLVSKYVIPALRRRKYTPGEYEAGAMYRRMVLGENFPNTDSDLKVGNEAAHLAMMLFTAGFGILCTKRSYYYMILNGDYEGYVKKLKSDEPLYKFSKAQFDRASLLAKTYFVDQVPPVTRLWNLNDFEKLPYVGPIPDPDNPKVNLTTELPGGVFVKDGYFVNPTTAEKNAIIAAENTPAPLATQLGGAGMLLFAGLAVGTIYYFNKRKRA